MLNDPALPGADWGDVFQITVRGAGLDAMGAATAALGRMPGWAKWLMALRNLVVRPLGLVTSPGQSGARGKTIGFFPVIEETLHRVVLGLDDTHLDFRIVVTVEDQLDGVQVVRAVTLVKRNNLAGRIYLACVMPFHKLIVPAVLSQIPTRIA